jgi:DNA-binding GntR family transcriptional regulator
VGAQVRHQTKTELALNVLRQRIHRGELEPGRRLHLNVLTHELGMSPTPIREALRLLQADGIVVYRPHQGIIVAETSAEQTAEVITLRCLLEPLAVELALPRLFEAQLRDLERLHRRHLAAVESGRGTAMNQGNVAWHWAIYDAAGSPLLSEFIRRLWEAYPWRTMWVLPDRAEQSAEEHERVMEGIRAGDASAAAESMRLHLTSGRETLLARLEDNHAAVDGEAG